MKRIPIYQIILFLVSLIVGRAWGMQYAAANAATDLDRAPRQSTHPVLLEKMPVDQINFLVVKVDALQSEQPQLENIWWLLHKRQGAINLVSLYPSLEHDWQADARLKSLFALTKDTVGYRLSQSFELLLESQNISWQGYLILDEVAFRQVLGDQPRVNAQSMAPLPYPEPASHLVEWRLFCRKNLQSSWQEPAEHPWIKAMYPQHLGFAPSVAAGVQIWQMLMSDTPANSCTFPVLDNQFTH